jgi:hypothetical protein
VFFLVYNQKNSTSLKFNYPREERDFGLFIAAEAIKGSPSSREKTIRFPFSGEK